MVSFFIHRNSEIRFDLADKETLMRGGWSRCFDEGALNGPAMLQLDHEVCLRELGFGSRNGESKWLKGC